MQDTPEVLVVCDPSQADSCAEYVLPGTYPRRTAQRSLPSCIGALWLMQRIRLSPHGIPKKTLGTSRVAVTMGPGMVVAVMPLMVTQLSVLSQSAVVTLRLPHRSAFAKKVPKTAPHFAHSLSRRPTLVVVDVDAASSLAPLTHLLSEGDFFPADTEATLKQETKP